MLSMVSVPGSALPVRRTVPPHKSAGFDYNALPDSGRRPVPHSDAHQEKTMSEIQDTVRNRPVSSIMQREVIAVDEGWSLEQLADFLVDNSISGAPVISEDDQLVGVVSLTDIVRQNRLQEHGGGSDATHDVYLFELDRHMGKDELRELHVQYETPVLVRDIMTPMIFSVSEDTGVQEVAETMIRGRIHRVFVTRESRLIGIVSALDMLKVIRDM
jgi:CBS domain-containing protein